jgi:FkbM family methyltransferase
MTVVDVGANFGYYSVLLADLVGGQGNLFAVEPNPHAADFLSRSIDLNGFSNRTQIARAALGSNDDGWATLYVPVNEPKNALVVADDFTPLPESGTVLQVPVMTLDHLTAVAARVDFIKIDAEGAEEAIVAGMQETILRHRPTIVLEFNAGRYTDPGSFLDRLTSLYGKLRRLDFTGKAVSVTREDVLSLYADDDCLLVLSHDKPA